MRNCLSFGGFIRIVKLIELRDIEHISLEFFWKSINCVCMYRSGLETKQTSCISAKIIVHGMQLASQ